MKIRNVEIGETKPCFIIAEAGVNHNGKIKDALELIKTAKKCGANAIKFQTFNTEKIVTKNAPKASYQQKWTNPVEPQFDMLKKLELHHDDFVAIKEKCKKEGILFISSPFDENSVDLLNQLDVDALKIASGELTNIPLLSKMAKSGRPIIMSTGMSYTYEIRDAVHAIEKNGSPSFSLLHCVSTYPTNPKDCNLKVLDSLRESFNVPIGFSDHTKGIEISLAAVALGASIIEKHLTLDRNLPGPDHKASLDPKQFKALVDGIRAVEIAIGDGQKRPVNSELNTREVARKSLVSSRSIPKGTIITAKHIAIKRPGTGIPPNHLNKILGRKTRATIPNDTMLMDEMLE